MDVQNACISKMVLDGEILPFIESKIDAKFFPDATHVKVYALIREHYKDHGKAPSAEAVHKAYPQYKLVDYPEPTKYYLAQLQQDRKKVILIQAAQEFVARINEEDEGPAIGDDLESILRQGLADSAHEISHGRDTDFFLSYDRMMERINFRVNNPGYLRGISTGIDGLDLITGGWQDQQLVTLIGTPKAGKSSLLVASALHAVRNDSSVLLVTFEMSTEEQEDRLISLVSGVPLTNILNGTLSKSELARIDKGLKIRRNLKGLTITSDITSATTISGVQAKYQQYRPDIVMVDGVYLMDDENGFDKGSPQALTNLTRGFKRMAQTHEVPVVCTTQAMLYRSKGGLKMDSIGYSSSFAQDSDLILGTEKDESVPGVSTVKVLGSRSSAQGEVKIVCDWSQGKVEELPDITYQRMLNQAPAANQGTLGSLWGQDAA